MMQERHREYVALSRALSRLLICKTTSETSCRTDLTKLRTLLFTTPSTFAIEESMATSSTDAADHIAQRSEDIFADGKMLRTDADLEEALEILGLPEMPTNALQISTAHAKRRREGGNDRELDQASTKVRRSLFTV